MKKTIGKPENWQDFESLCKKLWGEVWGIPSKIKKNGRLVQKQAGVDVYGIPKGESKYWGIQAKGKDDSSDAKLTGKEITTEIKKAKDFVSDEVFGKMVDVSKKNLDRYGRIVGFVLYENRNLSLELLKNGLAWHYSYYSDNKEMAQLEVVARENKVGLWVENNPLDT